MKNALLFLVLPITVPAIALCLAVGLVDVIVHEHIFKFS